MLKELIAKDVGEPLVTEVWRASEVGECEAFLCHLRLGHPALSLSGRVRHMLDDGLMHEHDVVDRLRSKGFKVSHSYSEGQLLVHCYDEDGLCIVGHPDGVLDVAGSYRGLVVPSQLELDYTDECFRFGERFYGLEVTAPNHFAFLRTERNHMRSEMWRKFVQIQMYLNSEELRDEGINSMIVEVKNKNTSALYEEGVGFDGQVVTETVEKLKRVTDLVSRDQVSSFRCTDYRRHYCRYRELCFGGVVLENVSPLGVVLVGESLKEAEELLGAADLWLKGRGLRADGEELVESARMLFGDVIAEYGAAGLEVGPAKAVIVVPTTPRLSIELDILKQRYPEVYDAMVTEVMPDPYLMVRKR